MPLVLKELKTGLPINASVVEENFRRIANKFEGGLTNEDFEASSAGTGGAHGIDVTSFEVYSFEKFVTLTYRYTGTSFSALTNGTIVDSVMVPGIPSGSRSITWSASAVEWVCNNTGDGAATFDLAFQICADGTYTDPGTHPGFTTDTITNASAADDANSDSSGLTGSSWSIDADTTENAWFILLKRGSAASTGCVDTSGDFLTVTIRLHCTVLSS